MGTLLMIRSYCGTVWVYIHDEKGLHLIFPLPTNMYWRKARFLGVDKTREIEMPQWMAYS